MAIIEEAVMSAVPTLTPGHPDLATYERQAFGRYFAFDLHFPLAPVILLTLVCAWLMHGRVAHGLIVAWLGFSAVANLARETFMWHTRPRLETHQRHALILTAYTWSSLASGLTWGAFAWLYLDPTQPLTQLVVGSIVAGLVGVSVTPLSIHLPAFYTFVLPMLAPYIVLMLRAGGAEQLVERLAQQLPREHAGKIPRLVVAADLPAGWRDEVLGLLDSLPARLAEYEILMTGQPIWRERLQGVGVITRDEAIALSATGPILRSTGLSWDLRRDMPYLRYDKVEFDVIVGSYGDAFDRYSIRLNEIRESMRIVRQVLDAMPQGDYRIQDKKVTPPPRGRIDESMEALIHHFKIFTEGFKVPEGEAYVAIESPRGEIGCYIVSDGSPKPYRLHMRAPSFVNIQALPHMMRDGLIADAVAVISSIDPVLGEVDR